MTGSLAASRDPLPAVWRAWPSDALKNAADASDRLATGIKARGGRREQQRIHYEIS
jgi:hypothetical protein